jgi:hypothetical protein
VFLLHEGQFAQSSLIPTPRLLAKQEHSKLHNVAQYAMLNGNLYCSRLTCTEGRMTLPYILLSSVKSAVR